MAGLWRAPRFTTLRRALGDSPVTAEPTCRQESRGGRIEREVSGVRSPGTHRSRRAHPPAQTGRRDGARSLRSGLRGHTLACRLRSPARASSNGCGFVAGTVLIVEADDRSCGEPQAANRSNFSGTTTRILTPCRWSQWQASRDLPTRISCSALVIRCILSPATPSRWRRP